MIGESLLWEKQSTVMTNGGNKAFEDIWVTVSANCLCKVRGRLLLERGTREECIVYNVVHNDLVTELLMQN